MALEPIRRWRVSCCTPSLLSDKQRELGLENCLVLTGHEDETATDLKRRVIDFLSLETTAKFGIALEVWVARCSCSAVLRVQKSLKGPHSTRVPAMSSTRSHSPNTE